MNFQNPSIHYSKDMTGLKSVTPRFSLILVQFLSRAIYICSAQSKNRNNSGIVLRKVRILTLPDEVVILTLRKTISELLLRKVGIWTKREYLSLYIYFY